MNQQCQSIECICPQTHKLVARTYVLTSLIVVSDLPDCITLAKLCLTQWPLRYTALGTGCTRSLQWLGRLNLPPSIQQQKEVSDFGLHNDSNNKWLWWVWTTAACQQTHIPSLFIWPSGAQCTFIK